jgi:putative SOS response-associated peptidase YedK
VCGRYAAAKDQAGLVEEFAVDAVLDPMPAPSWNVAPTSTVAMIVDRPGAAGVVQRQLRAARWGLVPSWAKDPSIGARMINARWEEAATKPAFRRALAQRRCLVPADGYFEWLAASPQAPRKTPKQPFFIHLPEAGASLALAGIYEFWRPDPEAEWLVSLSILTTAAQGPAARIHDRMPVIIDRPHIGLWLDPGPPPPLETFRLPADRLVTRAVGTAVNNVRNNGPQLLDAL